MYKKSYWNNDDKNIQNNIYKKSNWNNDDKNIQNKIYKKNHWNTDDKNIIKISFLSHFHYYLNNKMHL